jgi:DNA-binding response OmpR family regulator
MRILVVEDNYILAKILADHLAAQGHNVVQSYEGGLAARFCQQKEFDALVIDLVMPELNGIDVLEQLHRQKRMPRAIVITGFPEMLEELSTRLEAVGVETVIQKPFSFSDVDDALSRLH